MTKPKQDPFLEEVKAMVGEGKVDKFYILNPLAVVGDGSRVLGPFTERSLRARLARYYRKMELSRVVPFHPIQAYKCIEEAVFEPYDVFG